MSDDASTRFEGLYRTHYRAVAGFIGRRLRADLVDDAVHEVFLVAWRRATDVPDPGVGWLLAVARNVVSERYRAGSRLTELHQAAVAEAMTGQQTASGADVEAIERLAVFEALRRLSEDDQEVLMLAAWEGLDSAAAAEVLGCSSGSYRMRLSRARKRYEAALADVDRAPTAVASASITP